MKIAVVGSRDVFPSEEMLKEHLSGASEIISGGALGADTCAASYAEKNGIKLTEFMPQYELYGKAAPIVRNKKIADYADKIIAFWNGSSKGTLSVIKYAEKTGKDCLVILIK